MERLNIKIILLIFFGVCLGCFYAGANSKKPVRTLPEQLDTVFATDKLPHSDLIKDAHTHYTMLIYANHLYKSIKLLDEQVATNGNVLTVIQKLYDGSTVNIDSVLVDRNTLTPMESYSTITTSVDSFAYHGNDVKGTMLPIVGGTKQSGRSVDTLLSKPFFNGLIYAQTYQALQYKKGAPFVLAQYVPGHRASFERVEYVKDGKVVVAGVEVPAMELNIQISSQVSIQCWLSAKSQEVLKMEGQFPGFSYALLQVAS
jgi:hypothetical protein